MPHYVYVAAQDDNKIGCYTMNADTGALTHQADVEFPGGPSLLAISPDRRTLYAGHREAPEISSHRIDPASGSLTRTGSVTPEDAPAFLATDRTGRHLLASYYAGGRAAVHPIGADGELGGPPTEWLATADGAHSILTDRSNRFAYVPHIARIQDNVLEPPKNIPGPNVIFQFRFDADTGRLTPNDPLRVEMNGLLGPRHYCFHPSLDVVYFSDEQGSSVTAYNMDSEGRLTAFQTISTLPRGPHRPKHLLADPDDARRPVPVRPQPRPQQHCQLFRRRPDRRAGNGGPRLHRGRAQCVQSRPTGKVRLRSWLGHRTPRLVQYRQRQRKDDTPRHLRCRPAPHVGTRDNTGRVGGSYH